jgi:hypothetical protein
VGTSTQFGGFGGTGPWIYASFNFLKNNHIASGFLSTGYDSGSNSHVFHMSKSGIISSLKYDLKKVPFNFLKPNYSYNTGMATDPTVPTHEFSTGEYPVEEVELETMGLGDSESIDLPSGVTTPFPTTSTLTPTTSTTTTTTTTSEPTTTTVTSTTLAP